MKHFEIQSIREVERMNRLQ